MRTEVDLHDQAPRRQPWLMVHCAQDHIITVLEELPMVMSQEQPAAWQLLHEYQGGKQTVRMPQNPDAHLDAHRSAGVGIADCSLRLPDNKGQLLT